MRHRRHVRLPLRRIRDSIGDSPQQNARPLEPLRGARIAGSH
jgi:hypothetical protein